MQRPEPGLQMACHPFVGDTGAARTATAPAPGQLDPLGLVGFPFQRSCMLNEAKLHNLDGVREWLVNIRLSSVSNFYRTDTPMPESFKRSQNSLLTALSPVHWVAETGQKPNHLTKQSVQWAKWNLPRISEISPLCSNGSILLGCPVTINIH